MPFFSFILKSQSNKELVNTIKKFHKTTDIEKKYFSKNTQLWKQLLKYQKNNDIIVIYVIKMNLSFHPLSLYINP